MTDDTGFGVPSTFGGVIPTPNLDRIAANGLRYTNFNSTSLCSPTRAPPGGTTTQWASA
jgi:arylsulfatase